MKATVKDLDWEDKQTLGALDLIERFLEHGHEYDFGEELDFVGLAGIVANVRDKLSKRFLREIEEKLNREE
jgi:hypothetical protein